LIVLAAWSATLACQAAGRLLPAESPPTPTSTPSPAPTATRRPTLTPTALPDITALMLLTADLPKGFKSREIRNLDDQELKKLGMTREDFFLFENEQSRQVISGFRTLLPDQSAREDADFEIADEKSVTGLIASWIGADDIRDSKLLNGFEGIGDARLAVTFAYQSGGRGFRVDGAVFRRGSIYVVMTIDYPDGYKPLAKLRDLAAVLDSRIQEDPEVSH
jgi:hypothetical protein